MNDCDKSKSQLIAELQELRKRLTWFQGLEQNLSEDEVLPIASATASTMVSELETDSNSPALDCVDHRQLTYEQLQESLRLCEERLAEVQRVANLGHYSVDITNNTTYRSPVLLDILGINAEHPEDTSSWLQLLPLEQRSAMEEYVTDISANQDSFDKEYQIMHGITGQTRWVHGLGKLRFDEAGNPTEFFGTLQDITERKIAEEALRRSEKAYRSLINGMKEAVWVTDFNYRFIDVNQTASEMLQYSREELLTMGPPDIDLTVTVDDLIQFEQDNLNERILIFETAHTRKDGQTIPVEIQSTMVTYHGQDAMLSIARDITERKKAEAALQKSEAMNRLLAAVVHQAHEAIVITDLAGNIEYVNPAYETMTGFAADVLLGQTLHVFQLREPVDRMNRTAWEAVQQNETWRGRHVNQRKDGSPYHKDVIIFPVHNVDGQISNYCQIARDVSHEMELRQQLNQAQRLETIGTLAGGIAHDFNNILMPIIGHTEMVASKLSPTDSLQTSLRQILKGAERARDLVRQILTFSQQHEQQRCPIHLNMIVKEVIKLMRPSIPSTIEIRQNIDATCDKVLADASQLHQVLVNLCTNAFYAMETSGGILTISLDHVVIDHTLAQMHPNLQQKSYARMVVSDTGTGMDSATVERIFEPFFTTKPVDKGTGLGLSMAHGIIHSHEGALMVQSELGKGSQFQIYLPTLIDETDVSAQESITITQGNEQILLVDDEPTVTEVMHVMLEWLGYRVDTYNSSTNALYAFQRQPHKYDLVISDLTMPDMTGIEFAEKLQKAHAGIPVIIITGYGNNLSEHTQNRCGIRRIASKPIVMQELALLIRQVLDG